MRSAMRAYPLLWIWPLYLHVNQKSDDDDDDDLSQIFTRRRFLHAQWVKKFKSC